MLEMNDLPPVSIVITTHNRTNCALRCIDSLIQNIQYDGELRWIVADDRSDASHIARVKDLFHNRGLNVDIVQTDMSRNGQAASLNNGLKKAFEYSNYLLRTEDDWFLKESLPMTHFMQTMLSDENVCGIRLGCIAAGIKRKTYAADSFYDELVGSHKMFNLQVMLCKKSIYDFLGFYLEGTSGHEAESYHLVQFRERISKTSLRPKYKLLTPARMRSGTLDDPSLYFIHVGISVSGHDYGCPSRYLYLYNNTFHVVTACKNSRATIEKCANSILTQSYKSFTWVVVDDHSTDGTWEYLCELASSNKNIDLRRNSGNGMGSAWNTALRGCELSSYVMFLDSDDYFLTDKAFELVNEKLKETASTVDCVLLSYYNENNRRNVIFSSDDLDIAFQRHSTAPWSKCVRSSLYLKPECKFPLNRRCCNDVIEDLYLFSNIKSVLSIKTPLVFYSKSSPTSVWNNLTANKKIPSSRVDAISAVKDTVKELSSISFSNPYLEQIRIKKSQLLLTYIDTQQITPAESMPVCVKTESRPIEKSSAKIKPTFTFLDNGRKKHDAVFILGNGSLYQDKELLLAVHSMRKFCSFIDRIFVVGSKPKCNLSEYRVTHIPCDDPYVGNKDANIMHKVSHVIREVSNLSDNFLLCSDDQLVTQNCSWNDFKPKFVRAYSKEDAKSFPPTKKGWNGRLYSTLSDAIERNGKAWFYEPHIWCPVNKASFIKMLQIIGGLRNAGIVFSQYYNTIDNLDHEPIHDHRFFNFDSLDWSNELKNPPKFLSYNDSAFKSEEFVEQLLMLVK